NVAVSSAHLEPLPGVATLAPGPVSYSLTLYAIIESLATGGSVHVADAFDPFTIGSRIAAESITRIVAVPAVVKALAEAADRRRVQSPRAHPRGARRRPPRPPPHQLLRCRRDRLHRRQPRRRRDLDPRLPDDRCADP